MPDPRVMRQFLPSPHSRPADPSYGWVDLVAAGISAGGGIASAAIGSSMSKKAQAAQHKHEKEMAAQEAELLAVQMKQAKAQAAAAQRLMAPQKGDTTKTLMIVGGVVLVVGMVAAAVAVGRAGSYEDDGYEDDGYEDDDYGEYEE